MRIPFCEAGIALWTTFRDNGYIYGLQLRSKECPVVVNHIVHIDSLQRTVWIREVV